MRIQSQCIVTSDSLDFQGRRCSVLEVAIRTSNAFREDPTFVAWRSLVTRMWHRLRRQVGWPEVRGVKYFSREIGDLDARLKRQCACMEWGMSEEAFVCACALAEEENGEWRRLAACSFVPDFGCRVVRETMTFAVDRCSDDVLIRGFTKCEPRNDVKTKEEQTAETKAMQRKGNGESRIPKFISTSRSSSELIKGDGGSRRKSKIPIVPTMRRKRASISAIPLTPPKAKASKESSVSDRSRSYIPRRYNDTHRRLSFD